MKRSSLYYAYELKLLIDIFTFTSRNLFNCLFFSRQQSKSEIVA